MSVDVETTSFRECDIVQLSGAAGTSHFDSYVVPLQQIAPSASKVSGLSVVGNQLLLHGKPVSTVSFDCCLTNFFAWLQKFERPILLHGHNVKFDAKAILRSCVAAGLCEMFLSTVTGFCDTYSLFKEIVPGQKSYSQKSLVDNLIGIEYQAHNSLSDAIALQALVTHFNVSANVMLHHSFSTTWLAEHVKYLKDRNRLMLTLAPMVENKIVSKGIAEKISGSGLKERMVWFHYWQKKTSMAKLKIKSVQSALSDLKCPPERLQSQCNYQPFIT